MKYTQSLLEAQLSFFDLHKSRLKYLSHLVLALLEVRTVNLCQSIFCFNPEANPSSVYRWTQRFLVEDIFPFDQLSVLIWDKFQSDHATVVALDRTNWKFGSSKLSTSQKSCLGPAFQILNAVN